MFTFHMFIIWVYAVDSRSGPYSAHSSYVSGTCTFMGYSSSCSSLATMYHSNNSWEVIVALCALHNGTTSIDPSSKNILVRIASSTAYIDGNSCSNVSLDLKLWANASHIDFSLHISISKYQLFVIVSRVCINLCGHFVSSTELHKVMHYTTRSSISLSLVYICAIFSPSFLNLTFISLLHCGQSFIPSLCATHHLSRVPFRTTYSANILFCLGTYNSNAFTKKLISINPSYLSGSHDSIPIQHKYRVMHAHWLVETSCILCCQCSRNSFESDAQELILHQISVPSTIGFT